MSDNTNPFVSLEEDQFKASEIFGKNYQTALTDPNAQQQHQANLPATPPPTSPPTARLEFQDFNLTHNASPAYTTTSVPNPAPQQQTLPMYSGPQSTPIMHEQAFDDNTGLVNNQPQVPQGTRDPTAKPWQLDYYKCLFDVNTKQVLQRAGRSVIPWPPRFFELINPNPDLYGPFWIASTMVFLLAATGNVAVYLNKMIANETEHWEYDVNKLYYAAAVIYGYLVVMPIVLYAVFRFYEIKVKWMETICLYGYSFFIYIPVSILCTIPVTALRWVLVGLAGVISTFFVISNVFPAIRSQLGKGVIILVVMALMHLGFALTAQLYFFGF